MPNASSTITLAELRERRDEILRIAGEFGATNVRIFGSVARGDAAATSDVDFLVDIPGDAGGFSYFRRLEDLRNALSPTVGRDVDVVDSAGLVRLRERVMREAVPL